MRALAPPDVTLIKQLEQQARENPAAYRRKVGLLSFAGNLALTLIRILPIGLLVAVILMMFSNPLIQAVAVATLLLFLWTMGPNFVETGEPLTRTEAPTLYAAIDELRAKLDVPQEMNIVLDRSFNAGALEMPGLLGNLGSKRTLYLGVPLLAVLDRDELLAVIGHELGHFSHRHGPLGQRIYRARSGWFAYTRYVDESDSALDRGAAAFAHMFVPYFNAYSFPYGRQCEYEADADAAAAVGAEKAARALARSDVAGSLWFNDLDLILGRMQRELPVPPADLLERITAIARDGDAVELSTRLEDALTHPSDWLDTHPCLAERIQALRQTPALPPADGPGAGETLLGPKWPDIVAEYNRKWSAELASGWALEHARQHHLAALLEDAPDLHNWLLQRRMARAELLAAHTPEQAVAELREILRDHPGHPGASFNLGALTLRDEAKAAIALLEHAAKQDHGYRTAAYRRLESHYRDTGDAHAAYNYARRLDKARERRSQAMGIFGYEVDAGRFLPSSLPAGSEVLMREARKSDPCVTYGWMLTRDPDAPPPPPNPYEDAEPAGPRFDGQALILMVDPDRMQAANLTEDELANRYADCLRSIVPPNQLVAVRVLYTSEVFAPELKRALDALPDSCRI